MTVAYSIVELDDGGSMFDSFSKLMIIILLALACKGLGDIYILLEKIHKKISDRGKGKYRTNKTKKLLKI